MNKKIILISSAIVLSGIILFLILSNNTINATEIIESKDKYAAATTGLNLRLGPDKSSKLISVIPFGTKVTIEKSEGDEIFLDDVYGKWVNIKYGNKTGWIFSGYLCDFKPDTIKKYVADYYRDKYRKNESKNKRTNSKDSEVSIKDISGNYIVLEVSMHDEDRTSTGDVVWRYDLKQKMFFEEPIGGFYRNIYLFYLDDDRYPDFLGFTGDSPSRVKICLGSENGFTEIYDPNNYCDDLANLTVAGNCGDMLLTCWHREDSKSTIMFFYRFNCSKKKFELHEQYEASEINSSSGIITSIDLKKMSIVIRDKKELTDTSYKFHKVYSSSEGLKYLKNKFKEGGEALCYYVTIKDKKIILHINSSGKE